METLAQHRCFGGTLGYYAHASSSTRCDMRLSVFTPPKPTGVALIFLSGLTCTEDNFTIKAGAYRIASELGLTVVAPDTSPRGDGVPDDANIALGQGAGFYLDATQEPWCTHYRMESYVAHELPALIAEHFSITTFGLFGHSMGGHGALTIGLKYPETFRSLSAFAPVCTPSKDGWGPHALRSYLGEDQDIWKQYDATELMRHRTAILPPILIDQGLADSAYIEGRLKPEAFVAACHLVGQPVIFHTHPGYDHGYFFIQSFIEDHLRHHAQILNNQIQAE